MACVVDRYNYMTLFNSVGTLLLVTVVTIRTAALNPNMYTASFNFF